MKSKRRLATASLMLLVIGVCVSAVWTRCMNVRDPEVDLTKGVHFDVYESGKIVRSGECGADSSFVPQLAGLLHGEGGRWSASWVAYAPGIAVRGNQFAITIQRSKLVVNYADEKGRWSQVVTEVAPDVAAQLKQKLSNTW